MSTKLLTQASIATMVLSFVWLSTTLLTPSWSQSEYDSSSMLYGQGAAIPQNTLPNLPGQSTSVPALPNPHRAIAPAQVASSGTSMMASVILANGIQQIAIVDQPKTTVAVYHIDPATGDIQLKSVRRMDADFALEEFNLSEPTPSTIRKNVR